MSKEHSIPKDVINVFVEKKLVNNELVKEVMDLKFEMNLIKHKINSIEARRTINFDELIVLVKDAIPELGYGELTFDFETQTVEEKEPLNYFEGD